MLTRKLEPDSGVGHAVSLDMAVGPTERRHPLVAFYRILSNFTTDIKVSSDLALALPWPACVRQRLEAA